ncbi:hypothetical protein [Sabulibacter ruber]|uniref:hypothetical protein n=1 Tax=Sabulibacter ruber TaxID=2811901 RepID=UPI001A96EB95|nr:hypothetical protein [Sabulibacter ruber]
MKTTARFWLRELCWLLGILLLAFLIAFLIMRQLTTDASEVSFQMREFFISFSRGALIFAIFLLLGLLVYSVKVIGKPNKMAPNLCFAVFLVLTLCFLFNLYYFFHFSVTLYPPLSALPSATSNENEGFDLASFTTTLDIVISVLQTLLALSIFLLGVRIGRISVFNAQKS